MAPNTFSVALLTVGLSFAAGALAEGQSSPGVRANGMSGAFVAVADDASAVYWNPAGLATGAIVSTLVELGELEPAGRSSSEGAVWHRMLAFSLPQLGFAYYRQGVFAFGAHDSAVMDVPSRQEGRRGVHELITSTVAVSLLHSLADGIVVSATPKVVWGGDSTKADIDAGMMVSVEQFKVGLVARNIASPSFALDETGDAAVEVEPLVRIGAAWGSAWPGITRLIVAVDGDITARGTPSGDRRDVAAGVETWWRGQRLGVRGGVRGSTLGDSRAVVSAGVSAGLTAGFFLEGHVARGQAEERSWSVGARFTF